MKKLNRRGLLKTACTLPVAASLLKTKNYVHAADVSAVKNGKKEENKSWSLVILPDTQHYASHYPGVFHLQTQWIAENKDKYNIAYALHNGDITNNNTPVQWERASRALARIDGIVPYALTLGNHDYKTNGSSDNRSTIANDYFPLSRFEKMPGFGGPMESGKIQNTYHKFSAGGQDYLIICLEFGPRNETLDWAGQILKKHPMHKAIVLTHAYLYSDSTLYDWQAKGKEQKWNPHSYPVGRSAETTVNDGRDMWDKLVKKHGNVFMVVCGHVLNDGIGYLVDKGEGGNNVHQMLVNFQMLPVGGEGWLRILNFQPDGKTIKVEDYSPLFEKYKEDNHFTINL